ncbi:helix-turn-helix domain-containing protein [Nocardia sp. CA-129566]|uniref:helix-turn-helix domain-containing protein n=1 Tax=Nocardia sp. CA-129566 TaxID=3239976 RepID=UPI003D9683C0
MPEIEWTAGEVVALREALRLSRIEFARKLGVTRRTLVCWETERTTTLRAASRRLLYGVLSELAIDQRERFDAALSVGHHATIGREFDAKEVESDTRAAVVEGLPFDIVERREFVRLMGIVAAQISAPAATENMVMGRPILSRANLRVDEEVIDGIEAILAKAMDTDDQFGPGLVLRSVLTQRSLVASLLPDCPSQLRPRLLSVFANLTRFAGWLYFDMGDLASACKFYEEARTAAHEARDVKLAAFTLSHLSHLALWWGHPRLAVDHATAALNWARQTDDRLLVADAAEMAARAYAEIGEKTACLAILDENSAAMADSVGPHQPVSSLAYFYGPGLGAAARSHCMRRLGDSTKAEAAAQESLKLIDPTFVRDHAFSVLDLGNAYIVQREIEAASAAIADAANLAKTNQSGRLVEALRNARSDLAPWQDSIKVRELDQELATHGFL